MALDKRYNAREVEGKWQSRWLEEGFHKFDPNAEGDVYSFDTPPPFTSGTLHMGHIYNHVWIDLVARYRRMHCFNVYLPQGFDCHGLPTELVVEREMGVKKEDREEFIKKCVDWTDNAVKRMRSQFDAIGYSADWDYTYKTMDDDYKAMVQKSLLEFHKKDLLFRGKHPVLWCTKCETALAKAEVGYVEKEGKLYHIDLEVVDDVEGKKLTIATTRPEMMPACVAVFVHPDDERYTKYVGMKARLPLFNREVPIMEDDAVDREFGTGVVYLCTFGDEQDIKWQKEYSLPVIEAIDPRGYMTEVAGEYKGLPVEEARQRIVEDFENQGIIHKIDEMVHNVLCHTERGSCKNPIELLPLDQWFIKVRDYRKEIIKAAKTMNWYPEYMLQRLVDWTESMDWDWIISRQRVFGTPIPFWVCECGNVVPAEESELPVDPRGSTRKCTNCGKDAVGEIDVCDCWVDSSITPLRIARWGLDEEFFRKTYPSSLRPQGYEIIRTWAFYTIYRDLMLTGEPCFKDLMINGMVAGPDGRKMSKSLGNIIEPEQPLSKYSADALRQWASLGTLGEDCPFSWEECEHSQKFLTKLWNVSRFIEMHLEDYKPAGKPHLALLDKWILSRFQKLIEDSTLNFDKYVFNIPLLDVRSFIWSELADNYLEMVKHRLYKQEVYGEESKRAAQYTLHTVLSTALKLLSPYTPHIADEIHSVLFNEPASNSRWPEKDDSLVDEEAEEYGQLMKEVVAAVRKHKSDNSLSLGAELEKAVIEAGGDVKDKILALKEDIQGTGKIKELEVKDRPEEGYGIRFQ